MRTIKYAGTDQEYFIPTDWFKAVRKKPVIVSAYQTGDALDIYTLEGVMRANPGDWIVLGVSGEVYPVKSDIFEKTYEEV